MRLFSEEVTPTFTSSNLNILTVKEFYEVFFDVYELEINGKKYVTEKVSEYKGSPVVSVNIIHNNKEYSTKCVLQRGNFSFLVNEQTLKYEGESSIIDDDILIESTKEDEVEEIIFEKHESILEDIQKAKQSARDYLQKLKEQHEAQLIESQDKRAKEIKKELKNIRQDLVEEFIQIAANTQQEISESNTTLKKGITSKVNILTKALEGQINNKTESLQSLLEDKFNNLVLDITKGVISKKLDDGQKFVEENIKRVLQAVDDKLTTVDQVSIDLNDTIQKNSNKALSRIGNVKTQLEESITNSVTVLQHGIDNASKRIREYYDNELTKLNETVSLVGDETKKECIKLVSESRDSLLKTINEIKVEVPNIIIEKKDGTNQEIDLKKVKAALEKSITTRFSTELMSLKKMMEMMSGGGTVAQQFAEGGTMNGNLTVVGAISAQSYAGIPNPDLSLYLPLSGGTINGNLTVNGSLSADTTVSGLTNTIKGNTDILGTGSNRLLIDYDNTVTINGESGISIKADSGSVSLSGRDGISVNGGSIGTNVVGNLTVTGTLSTTLLEALSANITVIDIKQYELSGFNVQGNATVQGSVSATGNIIGAKLGAGIVPTQLIHSYSASDANTGIRAQVGSNWIDIRGNNGSGHPGITTSTGVLDITSVIGGHGGIGTPLRVKQNSGSGGSNLQTWLSSNNTVLGIVDNTGRFGIGTTTPNEKLTIVGNISATGDLSLSPASTIRTRIINSSATSGYISFDSSRLYGNSWGINYTANKITSTGFGFIAASVDFTDLFLERDSSNTLAQRNGGAAQEFRLYGTYGGTGGVDYERFFIKTNTAAATQIGVAAGGTGSYRNLEFQNGGSTRMTLTSAGNVGIGTAIPSSLLTVGGEGTVGSFKVQSNTYSSWFSVAAGNIVFNEQGGTTRAGGIDLGARFNIAPVNDSLPTLAVRGFSGGVSDIMRISSPSVTTGDYMVIKSTGNVGIGTTTPNEKLTVVGNISATGDITASGHLAAATKAFVIPHQTKPDKQLQHGCLEGPENSVYIRGTTSDSTIVLPDYWDWLVHEDSVTVTVTPVGKFQPLYVVSQDNNKVVVGGVEDKYNYTIYGTRKDVKPLEVEI